MGAQPELDEVTRGQVARTYVCASLIALAVGACGNADWNGQEPARPTVGPARSRAELIARGDRLCAAARERIRPVATNLQRIVKALQAGRIDASEYYKHTATLTDQTGAMATGTLSQLRALGHPPGRRRSLERYLAAISAHANLSRKIAAAQRHKRTARVIALNSRWLQASQLAHAAAKAYGFHVCGGN
jgi:hypothetical protein